MVYLFIDWANAYKQAKKLHNPNVFRERCASEGTFKTTTTTTTAEITFEGSVAKFVNNLKKYNYTDQAVDNGVRDLFQIFKSMADLECFKSMEDQLSTLKERKEFVKSYLPEDETMDDNSQRFVLMPHHLQVICCRCDTYEYPNKDQCFLFSSHRPCREEEIKKTLMYLRMNKYYTILLHERVTTGRERAATKKQGKSTEETVVVEKEKGVDVHIGVKITHTIRKAIEADSHIRIILVSGDADFKPVIQYAVDNGVPIDVWAWETNISAVYTEFLKEKEKEIGEEILFYLDDYLYQVGFATGVLHKWAIKFYKFFRPYPYQSTEKEREEAEKKYNSISHYTIAERLRQANSETNFNTSDFVIHWGKRSFTISFFQEYQREKFETSLKTSDDPLTKTLNALHHVNKEFVKQDRKPPTNIANNNMGQPTVTDKKSKYSCFEINTDDESCSDDEIFLGSIDDETDLAAKNDDKKDGVHDSVETI